MAHSDRFPFSVRPSPFADGSSLVPIGVNGGDNRSQTSGSPSSSPGGVFALLSKASTNPDWMPVLSNAQLAQACALGPAVVPETRRPVVETAAPSAVDNSTSRGISFLSFFRRDPPALMAVPQPPIALDGAIKVPKAEMALPVLPIDAAIPLHSRATGGLPASRAVMAPVGMNELSVPMGLGSDLWRAKEDASFDEASTRARQHHPKAPIAIDCATMPGPAPKPLWGDLPVPRISSLLSGGVSLPNRTVPDVSCDEPKTSFSQSASHSAACSTPVPPMPISTSPLREADSMAPMMSAVEPLMPTDVHAVRPIGEDPISTSHLPPQPPAPCDVDPTEAPCSQIRFTLSASLPTRRSAAATSLIKSPASEASPESQKRAQRHGLFSALISSGDGSELSMGQRLGFSEAVDTSSKMTSQSDSKQQAVSSTAKNAASHAGSLLFKNCGQVVNDEDEADALEHLRITLASILQMEDKSTGSQISGAWADDCARTVLSPTDLQGLPNFFQSA